MRSTRALVDVLSADPDPKMRASKFLQFVSKMSKGELILEDNKVRVENGVLHMSVCSCGQQPCVMAGVWRIGVG